VRNNKNNEILAVVDCLKGSRQKCNTAIEKMKNRNLRFLDFRDHFIVWTTRQVLRAANILKYNASQNYELKNKKNRSRPFA